MSGVRVGSRKGSMASRARRVTLRYIPWVSGNRSGSPRSSSEDKGFGFYGKLVVCRFILFQGFAVRIFHLLIVRYSDYMSVDQVFVSNW
jgi:hypothetical protein